jgi:hypothetical protein
MLPVIGEIIEMKLLPQLDTGWILRKYIASVYKKKYNMQIESHLFQYEDRTMENRIMTSVD